LIEEESKLLPISTSMNKYKCFLANVMGLSRDSQKVKKVS